MKNKRTLCNNHFSNSIIIMIFGAKRANRLYLKTIGRHSVCRLLLLWRLCRTLFLKLFLLLPFLRRRPSARTQLFLLVKGEAVDVVFQLFGREIKPSLISRVTPRVMLESKAANLSSKLYFSFYHKTIFSQPCSNASLRVKASVVSPRFTLMM